jgi:hypothetical protein
MINVCICHRAKRMAHGNCFFIICVGRLKLPVFIEQGSATLRSQRVRVIKLCVFSRVVKSCKYLDITTRKQKKRQLSLLLSV